MMTRRLLPLAALLCLVAPTIAVAQQAETIEYYQADLVGSIRIVYDANGNVIGRQDYTPFGTPVLNGTSMPKEGFGGNEKDDETQEMYFHARSLAARTGRFSSVDPIYAGLADPQEWNRYAYAHNSPIVFVDPDGLQDLCKPGSYNCAAKPPDPGQCPAWATDGCVIGATDSVTVTAKAPASSTPLGDIMAGISYLVSRLTDTFSGTVVLDSAELVPTTPSYRPSSALQTTATVLTVAAVIASPVAKSFMAKEAAAGVVDSGAAKAVFHWTFSTSVDSILENGLAPGSYTTPAELMSSVQAQIELGLTGDFRNAVLQVDLAGLRSAGYAIPQTTRIAGVPGGGAGGGYQIQFPYAIPPQFISVVKR